MDTRKIDLRKLNSITKYPSILTYHALGDKGVLKDEVQVPFGDEKVYATEKVDGTNARIVYMPDGTFIIGSREEFLYGKDDLIINPAQHIVPTILETAHQIQKSVPKGRLSVYYGEVYGHSIGSAAKNYTKSDKRGFRLFDAFGLDTEDLVSLLEKPSDEISHWREGGGQPFVTVENLAFIASMLKVDCVPDLYVGKVPHGIKDTHEWLAGHLSKSLCALEGEALCKPEGIVIRNSDRTKIAKIRYEDYERTLRKMAVR